MRLIDADALISAMQTWDWQELYLPIHFKELLVDEAQTIDAVPVVRCKDCVFWMRRKGCVNHKDMFCSYGQREENNEN